MKTEVEATDIMDKDRQKNINKQCKIYKIKNGYLKERQIFLIKLGLNLEK